jgi:hypothetical protein
LGRCTALRSALLNLGQQSGLIGILLPTDCQFVQ